MRGLLNVYAAAGIAWQGNWPFCGDTEAMAGQADYADAYDRTFELACETGDRWIGFAAPAKECHVDAAGKVLIHQHAEMFASVERGGHFQRRLCAAANQMTH